MKAAKDGSPKQKCTRAQQETKYGEHRGSLWVATGTEADVRSQGVGRAQPSSSRGPATEEPARARNEEASADSGRGWNVPGCDLHPPEASKSFTLTEKELRHASFPQFGSGAHRLRVSMASAFAERKAGHDRRRLYTPAGQSLLELDGEQLGEQIEVLRAIAPWDDVQVRVTKPVTRRRTKGDHTAQRTALAERADFQDNVIFTDAAWNPDTFRGAVAAVRGQQRDAQAFQYCQEQPVRSLELQAILYALEKLTEYARTSPLCVRGQTFHRFYRLFGRPQKSDEDT
ncbi:hypothetical protein HPB48_020777 [Haemaphysalis longicornis]|uniref:Uncharacterized protein n=1 Tax=Haemaphysalis longicornis TaxID=44386 RepID=A0A9J6FBA3_HAELO|nr:hypothetical protein HPB48_020777 [Haemaphysalis longicornis]